MKISVITMFPEFFESPLETSLVNRSQADGLVEIEVVDFPAVVTMDAHGNSLHAEVEAQSRAVLQSLLAT